MSKIAIGISNRMDLISCEYLYLKRVKLFIYCNLITVFQCAGQVGFDWNIIHTCYTEEGNALFEEMGRLTDQYAPDGLPWVPVCGINGVSFSLLKL